MRAIMYSCLNWGDIKCNVEVSQFARWSKVGGDKEITNGPCGPTVNSYNEICRACGHRQFEIREKRCKVCESTDIQLIGSGRNGKNPSTGDAIYYYRCNKCDSGLVSDIKL